MNLPDLEALDKIIQLCRKRGVESIEIDNVKIVLSTHAPEPKRRSKKSFNLADDGKVESDSLSPDELLFWSTNDPSLEDKGTE